MKKITEKEKNFHRNYQQMKRGHGIKYRFLFDEVEENA